MTEAQYNAALAEALLVALGNGSDIRPFVGDLTVYDKLQIHLVDHSFIIHYLIFMKSKMILVKETTIIW